MKPFSTFQSANGVEWSAAMTDMGLVVFRDGDRRNVLWDEIAIIRSNGMSIMPKALSSWDKDEAEMSWAWAVVHRAEQIFEERRPTSARRVRPL